MGTGVATRAQCDAFLREMYLFDAELRALIDARLVCRHIEDNTVPDLEKLTRYLLAVSQATIAVEENLAGSVYPLEQAIEPHREAILGWLKNRTEWLKREDENLDPNIVSLQLRKKALRQNR